MKSWTRIGPALLATAMLLAGCASTPKDLPALEQARQELEMTRADPNAQRYSTKEIEEAQRLLTAAEGALEERKDETTVSHLAYLSMQSSRIAREQARAKGAEERIASAAAERARIRLTARTREADAAKLEAEQAQSEAQQAQSAAQQAQSMAEAARSQLAMEQQRRAQAEEEMESLMAKRSDRGLVVTLGDVLFDTGKAELKSGADRHLDAIATFLSQRAERHVLVEGFTDSVGTDSYNADLSERRADAVRSALLARGVPPERVQIQGYGERFPVATNDDAGGRQLNRRVEVIVSTGPEPVTPRTRL